MSNPYPGNGLFSPGQNISLYHPTTILTGILLAVDVHDMLDKLWRFLIVGGGGFFIDVSITFMLLRKFSLQKYSSNSIGFMCGVSFNYWMNRTWTFASLDPHIIEQFLKFIVIGAVGLVIVNGVVYILHTRNGILFFWSKVLAMFIFMFWNFSANYFYTFA